MRASELVQVTGARLVKRGRKRTLKVAPGFGTFARSHKTVLLRAIEHPDEDIDLAAATSADALHALGFTYDSDLGWCCSEGTAIGERIILGLEPPREHMPALGARVVTIEAELVSPGRFKWTEPKGVRAMVYHRGRRIA